MSENNNQDNLNQVVWKASNAFEGVLDKFDSISWNDLTKWWSWWWSFATLLVLIWTSNWLLVAMYLILWFIPFINLLSFIWFFIYWWLNGKSWILNNTKFISQEEKNWVLKFSETVWKVLAILFAIFFIWWILLMVLGFSLLSRNFY